MSNLLNYCQYGPYDLRGFTGYLVHYGTNDLRGNVVASACANSIVHSLDQAINFIRSSTPGARLGVSGILPRPRDIKSENLNMINARAVTNVALMMYCANEGIEYYKSETCLKKRDPGIVLYHDDDLHLSEAGSYFFQMYLEGKIGEMIGPVSN